ncbi:MAG TPA: FliH/SctL family protein [Stellaceae bacterium]|nr:FliH/SctL family protein [Stellaceae bacterium]
MKRRLNLSEAVVVPWEIPDIDAAAQKIPLPEFFAGPDPSPPGNAGAPPDVTPGRAAAAPPSAASPADPRQSPGYAEGLELGIREGRERGYAEGFVVGRQAADLQFADHVKRLEGIVRQLGEPSRALERPVEEAVLALALEVARWVIGGEVARSRDYLVRLIREAVAKVPIDVGAPSIVLNPADVEIIRSVAPDLENHGVTLIADEATEPGGCKIVAHGADDVAAKDRRWHPRALQGICEVDLTLASRWRDAMFAMFEGEDA